MQVARQEAEERLQEAEAAALSHQTSFLQLQQQSQATLAPQLKATGSDDSYTHESETELGRRTHDAAESSSTSEQTPAELLPTGITLQLTNPIFSHQGDGVLQNPMQVPEADEDLSPSMAEPTDDQQRFVSHSAKGNHIRNPGMAEGLTESDSALTILQLQQQLQELRSALDTQASQLQNSDAEREYIRRLLNAVTVEPNSLSHQLDSQHMLKQASPDPKHESLFLSGSAGSKVRVAEAVPEGLVGLQPATSHISATWLTDPSVRRNLLPEYGLEVKPYARDGPALEGAESIMGPHVAESSMHVGKEADSLLSEASVSGELSALSSSAVLWLPDYGLTQLSSSWHQSAGVLG